MTSKEKSAAKKTCAIIRTARKTAGLTQQELAKKMDISQSALSKLENASLLPSAYQWFRFCEVTRIAPESFITGKIVRAKGAAKSGSRKSLR